MDRCWVQPAFTLACGWVRPAGLVRSEDFASFFVGLLELSCLLGPPPVLAGLGRVKLSSKVPPIVRVCGLLMEADAGVLGRDLRQWLDLTSTSLPQEAV